MFSRRKGALGFKRGRANIEVSCHEFIRDVSSGSPPSLLLRIGLSREITILLCVVRFPATGDALLIDVD